MSQYALNPKVQALFETTEDIARNFGHVTVRTTHLFLNTITHFKQNEEDGLAERFFDVLRKYEITGANFIESMDYLYPQGPEVLPVEIEVIGDKSDFLRLHNTLMNKGIKESRTQEMADLLLLLINDKTYKVHNVLEGVLAENEEGLVNGLTIDKLIQDLSKLFLEFVPKTTTPSMLDEIDVVINLNEFIKEKKPTIIGLDKEIEQLEIAMNVRTFQNVVLVGPAGTGKTTVVWELARRINEGNVTNALKGKTIYELDLSSLVAGTKYRGEFEQRLTTLINILKEEPDSILFIDEIHMMTTVGDNEGGATTSNILKKYLSTGEITVIGATTNDEYAKHIEKDKAISRRFHKVLVNEPNDHELSMILNGVVKANEKYHDMEMEEGLIEKVVELGARYDVGLHNPSESINILELGFAYARVDSEDKVVKRNHVMEAISKKYSLNVVANRTEETRKKLLEVLKGQDNVIDRIMHNIEYVEAGLVDPQKPLASFLFAGPTGVGKTETAKIIAEAFFGTSEHLIRLNMGEYTESHSVSKLIGSAPGYIGHDDETGLVSQIKQRPASVILVDEFEKAHPDVQKVFLSILDEGQMNDQSGETIRFNSSIVIFTTNLGYDSSSHKMSGLAFNKKQTSEEDVLETIKNALRPEFINRIDSVYIFNRLTDEIAKELIDRYVGEFGKVIDRTFKLTEQDYQDILKRENIEEYGARGLKRATKAQILEIIKRGNDLKKVNGK